MFETPGACGIDTPAPHVFPSTTPEVTTTTVSSTTTITTTTTLPGGALTILGKSFLVKDPGSAAQRRVVAVAKERASNDAIIGDPRVDGATLRIIANGITDSDETLEVEMGGWTALGPYGYRYSNRHRGGAVRRVLFKRTKRNTLLLKVAVSGKDGPLDVVPPNSGDSGGLILTIGGGGGSYCVAFGGAAGGRESGDNATVWKVRSPTAEACPAPTP